jgi:uncharacterized repeat protein (TIGR01451 family)
VSETTTFVSSTQLTANVAAAQLTQGALLSVQVLNAGTTASAPASAINLEVDNPTPAITQLAPTAFITGTSNGVVTVTGTGFVPTTTLQVGGAARATTFISTTQLGVALTAADLAAAGSLSLTAVNPAPSGGTSAAAAITVSNPMPAITSMTPSTVIAGTTSATTVTVTGINFLPTSTVQVDGSSRVTTYKSSTQLSFQLTATDQATAGSVTILVSNPAPGGGSSAAASIAVNNPTPAITSMTPSSVAAGATSATTVTVTGINFLSTSTVQVGGSSRTTTYHSSTQLSFLLTVADQATPSKLAITVSNATTSGGSSTPATLTVTNATTPVITSVYPTQFTVGLGGGYLGIFGSNFNANSVVQWNGTALATTDTSGSYLSAVVPASFAATVGTANITVVNSTATPPTSNAVTVSIVNPPAPTLTSIYPSSAPMNTTTPIALYGTGFSAASTVAFNGVNVPATYVGSYEMQLTVPASSVALPNAWGVTVTTPAPGGGTTAPLAFTSYISLPNNSMVYNPVNGLLYASVPSSAGAPYGNSIVSVDPETGALGTPIPVGSEPNKLALSSDGTILWVGLDGASAVRQVNLTTNTAGLQFTLGNNGGIYENPATALALAALPGSPNSVVVSMSNGYSELSLAIYDNGTLRGSGITGSAPASSGYALQVDGTKSEIYAGAQNSYNTFTYSSAGITAKATASNGSYASASSDEMQIAGGVLYTDFGTAYDPEAGALLGTFYSSGTTAAAGPTVADTTLGKLFVLDNSSGYTYGSYNQIQVFNTSNYIAASSSVIPISLATPSTITSYASRLTRWGTNRLAFRNAAGIYSLRSNLVKDLSSVSADLSVTLTGTGTGMTGSNTTYTATISNAGPSAATNVGLTALLPASSALVSATPSAGTCSTSTESHAISAVLRAAPRRP